LKGVWVVVLSTPETAALGSAEYLKNLKIEYPGTRLAVLTVSDALDGAIADGTADVLVRPDWEKAFVTAAKLVRSTDTFAHVTIDPVILRASGVGEPVNP
jgi:hypothetical protein